MEKRKSRCVTFAPGTAEGKEVAVALSIPTHENFETLGYTCYTIELYRYGKLWILKKRYRHFVALHKHLVVENDSFHEDIPVLPQKRWFETQRWINRFDTGYSLDRRRGLQDYLRALVKNAVIVSKSRALRYFLEIPDSEVLLSSPSSPMEQNARRYDEPLPVGRGYTLKTSGDEEDDEGEPDEDSEYLSNGIIVQNIEFNNNNDNDRDNNGFDPTNNDHSNHSNVVMSNDEIYLHSERDSAVDNKTPDERCSYIYDSRPA